MSRLMHLTIFTKIVLGFATVLVFTAALGAVAVAALESVNTAATVVGTRYLPATRALDGVAFSTMRYRQLEATVALAPDPASRAAQEAIMRKARGETEDALARYRQLFDIPAQDLSTELRAAWAHYLALDGNYFRLLDAADPDAASALYMGEMRGRFHALQMALDHLASRNNEEGLSAVRHGARVGALATRWILAAVLMAALLSCAVGTFLICGISKPISGMTSAMRRLASRDMAVEIPCAGQRNEIGAMAGAVSVFRDTMIESDALTAEREAAQAIRHKRAAHLEALVGRFEQQIGGTVSMLSSASSEMETTARSMTGSAARTDRQATEVARAAEESSLGVQTVAAASAQLAASIAEINRQVAASSSLSGRVVVTMRQADDTVRTLAGNAERIGEVVKLINSIATQTNLLALNATIEAARAGDLGKGFAVVASEVKTLAHETAHATGDIGALVTQMQQAGAGAVAAMRDVVALIDEVNATTTSIAAAVEEQGVATTEIAHNVRQTAGSTGTVTTSIAGVSQAANDTGTAARQVLDAAGNLSRRTETLSNEVASFIADVRRA